MVHSIISNIKFIIDNVFQYNFVAAEELAHLLSCRKQCCYFCEKRQFVSMNSRVSFAIAMYLIVEKAQESCQQMSQYCALMTSSGGCTTLETSTQVFYAKKTHINKKKPLSIRLTRRQMMKIGIFKRNTSHMQSVVLQHISFI